MKEMKTHENAIALLSTVIGMVLTMVLGTGLSILLGGFVRGFLALAAAAITLTLIVAWRHPFSLQLQLRDPVPGIELVRRRRSGGGQRREPVKD
jgi:hypothetical protein